MSFFDELKRRNVFRVAIAYAVAAWLLLQLTEVLSELLALEADIGKIVVILLVVGFVPTVIFAWAFELTPEGVRREKDVDRGTSIAPQTGKKLDRIILAGLVIVILAMAIERAWFAEQQATPAGLAAQGAAEPAATPAATPAPAEAPASANLTHESVAVLPFTAMSSGEDDEYFADGLTEEILNSLAGLPELLVTARTSSFHFKGKDLPIPEIAQTLGVDHVVEGSVRRAGDRVRITAQLIRAEDGFHLWSNTYDRTLEDVFAVQEDIANNIAATLDVVLDEDKRQKMRDAGIGNVEAFIAYQKGLDAYERAHQTDEPQLLLADATRWLDEALAKVPDIDSALYLRTDFFGHILLDHATGLRDAPPDKLQNALVEIHRSLSRAASVARNKPLQAILEAESMIFTDDWSRIPALLEQAFEPGHCNPLNWLGEFAEPYGYAAAITAQLENTIRCDPLAGWPVYAIAGALIWDGQPQRALEHAEHYLGRAPFHPWVDDARFGAKLALDPAASDPAMLGATPEGSNFGLPRAFFVHALRGDLGAATASYDQWLLAHRIRDNDALHAAAATGDRAEANRLAGIIDSRIGGQLALTVTIGGCKCGAPFDLDVTPNFRARLAQTGFAWPPPAPYKYPAKDW